MLVLGLESSCDDCSAAVVEETASGPVLRSMTKRSQDTLHGPYGGVVPELAAREHLLQMRAVIAQALAEAGVGLASIGRIAVTQGPGLVGCLLTTFSAAKAISWRMGIPFVGVHHLLGHLNAARFGAPDLPFPALALLVSGGHTHLYRSEGWTHLELLMKTRDDAAGEAFDKTARLMNLGYPGGPIVDACAAKARSAGTSFTPPKFRDGVPAWSFSGLKTAVRREVEGDPHLESAGADDPCVQALCKGLQEAISTWLLHPIPRLAEEIGARSLIISGGVACNSRIRADGEALARRLGLAWATPAARFCTDNGAMIAAAGALLSAIQDPWAENADPALALPVPLRSAPWK